MRWFTAQLGDARNLDVYLERELAGEERRSLTDKREQAYERVIEAMDSQRQRDLMLDLVGWIALGDWRSSKPARRPIAPYAEKRLELLWSTIATPAADIAAMDEVDRHALRIQVKKMRYAVEFLSGVFPDEAGKQKRFAADVEDLQEELGKLNDLVTARELAMADPSGRRKKPRPSISPRRSATPATSSPSARSGAANGSANGAAGCCARSIERRGPRPATRARRR